jgi:hypothetical protein
MTKSAPQIHMRNAAKRATAFLVGCTMLCFVPLIAQAQEGKVNLYFQKNTMSADIDGAPLKAVLAEIKEKTGISFKTWFGGDQTLNEKVSVRFRRLSVKEGLERILSKVNHSIVLKGSEVSGVMLFGKPGKPDRRRPRGPQRRTPRSPRRRSKVD